MIGTDGLFDNISHVQLGGIVARGSFDKSFEEISQIYLEQPEDQWLKDDDIAFLLIRKMRSENS